jgi:hypothetical protein
MSGPQTPTEAYMFPDLPPPASWESDSLVIQAARERLEQRIAARLEKVKAEKKAALNAAVKAASEARAAGTANVTSLNKAANKARAEAATVGKGTLSRQFTNAEATKLYADIDKFREVFEHESSTRTASAKSAAATTPPTMVYRKSLLAKLRAHKARNPGTRLSSANFDKYKKNVLASTKKATGISLNAKKIDPDSYFKTMYNSNNFKGGAKRKTMKNRC